VSELLNRLATRRETAGDCGPLFHDGLWSTVVNALMGQRQYRKSPLEKLRRESGKISRGRKPKRRRPAAVSATNSASAKAGFSATAYLQNPRYSLILAALIFAIHLIGLALLFEPLSGLFDPAPLIDQDWGLHFHHLKSMEAIWRQDKTLWGYNPLFMAGYPSNTIQDLSIKLFEIIAIGLSTIALTAVQWFKLSGLFAMASVSWLMYFAARNLFDRNELKNITAPIAAALGTIYWWNSLPREMFFYGMIGFPTAAYLSVLGVSLFYRIARQPATWSPLHLAWFCFTLMILPLHVQAIVMVSPAVVALLIGQPSLLKRNLLLSILGGSALALLANQAWLVPAFNHRGDDMAAAIVSELPFFANTNPLIFILDYLGLNGLWSFRPSFWEKGLRLMLLVLGALGTMKLLRGEHKLLGIMIAGALIGLFLLTYFGSLLPFLKGWQPLRFKVPYDLFLVLAAAYFIADWLTTDDSITRSYLVPCLLIGATVAFLMNLVQTESQGKMSLRTRILPEITAVVEWVQRETPNEARVLFEESGDETGFVYDGMYLSAFLPHWTGRQLIGGPINLYNDRHHFAEFHSGKMFKKDVQTIPDEELRNYLQLYNIGAVVAFHPASIQRLQSIPGLVTTQQLIGPVHLMKVNQPLTWFLQGEGKVKAGFNRLELSELKGNELILKYHWTEGLTATTAATIAPVMMADDPIPFIKIIDPPSVLTLRVGP
jgi:hypothetical protein